MASRARRSGTGGAARAWGSGAGGLAGAGAARCLTEQEWRACVRRLSRSGALESRSGRSRLAVAGGGASGLGKREQLAYDPAVAPHKA